MYDKTANVGNSIEKYYSKYLKLSQYVKKENFKSYDPFDGLNSNIFTKTRFGNNFLNRLRLQMIKRFPLNLRQILGIRKSISSKTLADILSSEILILKTFPSKTSSNELRMLASKVMSMSINSYSGIAWGLPFDYSSRLCKLPRGVPNMITSYYCANALLDYYELIGNQMSYETICSVSQFIINDLGYLEFEDGSHCFCYVPIKKYAVHNANLLGAALLTRIYKHIHDDNLKELIHKAVCYSIARQRPDGSWFYGEDNNLQWIDGFHTGYNLDSLYYIWRSFHWEYLAEPVKKGYKYFLDTFFLEDGRVKYYNNGLYPIDMQCIAQSIQTLCLLRSLDDRSIPLAIKTADWTIKNLQDNQGYFYPQMHKYFTIKTPYFRWSDTPMMVALAHLISTLDRSHEKKGSHN